MPVLGEIGGVNVGDADLALERFRCARGFTAPADRAFRLDLGSPDGDHLRGDLNLCSCPDGVNLSEKLAVI